MIDGEGQQDDKKQMVEDVRDTEIENNKASMKFDNYEDTAISNRHQSLADDYKVQLQMLENEKLNVVIYDESAGVRKEGQMNGEVATESKMREDPSYKEDIKAMDTPEELITPTQVVDKEDKEE